MEKIIKFKELKEYVPLSRSSIWRSIQTGDFPTPISLSNSNSKNAAKGWFEQDVIDWINHKRDAKNKTDQNIQ